MNGSVETGSARSLSIKVTALAFLALCWNHAPILRGSDGCGIVPPPTGTGSISGVVRVQATKQPLPGVKILATLHSNVGTALCWSKDVTTDQSGAYLLTDLPRGRYSIAANTGVAPTPQSPFQGTFYPGVQSETDAQLVSVPDGARLSGIDLTLSGPLPSRRVVVDLIWPDGRPAAGEVVNVSDTRGNHAGNVVMKSGGGGIFDGCAETAYIFRAQRIGASRTDVVHTEPVTVAAGSGDGRVLLILSAPGYWIDHHRGDYRLAPNPTPARSPK
jgi:hypothetical protein